MDLFLPYIACITLALTVYAALRPALPTVQVGFIAVGIAASGWLIGIIIGSLAQFGDVSHGIFFIIFSLCAIAAAIRMITHDRPIYSALHFVLVVISTAGLLLMLEAEFMAFALIIVYAGAILITYMFVLMLANQAENPEEPLSESTYDSVPREPAAAVAVGFLLLCLLSGTVISGTPELDTTENTVQQWNVLEKLPKQFETNVRNIAPDFAWPPVAENENAIRHNDNGAYIVSSDGIVLDLDESMIPTNTQLVGWSLVNDFPVTIELAGVILLMAMFGAAVLARRAIELTERDKRKAILGFDSEETGGDS
jgi:NADH-quinone oxidoreductase subunit J